MSTRLAAGLRAAGGALLDVAFPPACPLCLASPTASPPSHGLSLCGDCLEALAGVVWEGCPVCAAPRLGDRCIDCDRRRYAFQAAAALGPYDGAWKEAVLRSKQARFEPLTLALGTLLGRRLGGGLPARPDWTAAVPIHWRRRWTRGVHGAALLAEGVAAEIGAPLAPLLACRRSVRKQGTLAPDRRFSNVRGAFRASRRYDVQGACVLLVDDVMTTGATLSEAARVLRRAGAAQVMALVIARGTGRRDEHGQGGLGGQSRRVDADALRHSGGLRPSAAVGDSGDPGNSPK